MKLIHLQYKVNADGVAEVAMNRPPVHAQNLQMRDDLMRVFDTISEQDEVRCAILTGTGNIFSAGADIKERPDIAKQPGGYMRHNRWARESIYAAAECTKPVIAAINGPALGAGFAIALCCDILIASENAYVAMPEIDVGLAGGGKFLQRAFGRSRMRHMYFTGKRVPAKELFRLGIIEECVPQEQLMDAARAIGREIASKSPLAIRLAKGALNAIEELGVRDGYRFEQSVTVELSRSDDAKEAQRAFIEKRKPNFTGR